MCTVRGMFDNAQSGITEGQIIAMMKGWRIAALCCAHKVNDKKGNAMSIGTILLIVLALALVGVIPIWGHSRQ